MDTGFIIAVIAATIISGGYRAWVAIRAISRMRQYSPSNPPPPEANDQGKDPFHSLDNHGIFERCALCNAKLRAFYVRPPLSQLGTHPGRWIAMDAEPVHSRNFPPLPVKLYARIDSLTAIEAKAHGPEYAYIDHRDTCDEFRRSRRANVPTYQHRFVGNDIDVAAMAAIDAEFNRLKAKS